MPSQKRILHLRSKNKLLLDKLESHSSRIEAELKYLKRTLRGAADRSPAGNDIRYKNWAKRNNSLQVNDAFSSCTKSANDGVRSKYTLHSRSIRRKSKNAECQDENDGRGKENVEIDPVSHPPNKDKQTAYCALKSIHQKESEVDETNQNSKTIREIISTIDYSPQSTFLKRMKSKCKPYTREVYCRLQEDEGNHTNDFHMEKEARRKKKIQVRCPRGTPIRKARICDVSSAKEGSQLTLKNSVCPECGKRVERQPITRACEDGSSGSEEPCKHERMSKKNEEKGSKELKRLKKFRERNWQDCHADPSMGDSFHCCGHKKCKTVYGINDRLFALPLDESCEDMVHCPSCPHLKCPQPFCTHSKQVIVTIPATLLESDAGDADRKKKLNGATESIPVSKELLKKLQRPVPQNSMALRYQKGLC
ncbi:uncharacterized protein [Hetaerina americana]|uniref:uncharacterized protein isoform X2 n=1 Tax=Hetaerina americana TaxID=62018 RepID=UPI003A7F4737